MTLSFTRAALKDPDLEDVSIVIENALVEGRFWLPHRQELEIRRTGTWLDYPVRGIIRGRWEIDDYEVNTPRGWCGVRRTRDRRRAWKRSTPGRDRHEPRLQVPGRDLGFAAARCRGRQRCGCAPSAGSGARDGPGAGVGAVENARTERTARVGFPACEQSRRDRGRGGARAIVGRGVRDWWTRGVRIFRSRWERRGEPRVPPAKWGRCAGGGIPDVAGRVRGAGTVWCDQYVCGPGVRGAITRICIVFVAEPCVPRRARCRRSVRRPSWRSSGRIRRRCMRGRLMGDMNRLFRRSHGGRRE